MRRLLIAAAFTAAVTAPTAPASASHCEVEYKELVCACPTASRVYRAVFGEDAFYCG